MQEIYLKVLPGTRTIPSILRPKYLKLARYMRARLGRWLAMSVEAGSRRLGPIKHASRSTVDVKQSNARTSFA